MKIYLSPSSQRANTYAAGNTNEQEQCARIAEFCRAALERCGVMVRVGKAKDYDNYAERINESNEWGADVHVPIHTNAGGGHGPVVFVYDSKRKAVAQPVYDALNCVVPTPSNYGVRYADYAEIRGTTAICVYVEAAFHDNAAEADWIVRHAEELGESIAFGLCEGFGITYVAPSVSEPKSLTWAKKLGIVRGDTELDAAIAEAICNYHFAVMTEDSKTVSGLLEGE